MRLTRSIAAAALLTITMSACGGDAVAGYVDRVAATTEQMTRDAFVALPPGAAPTRPQVQLVVAARRTALDTISGLTPPAEMEPEHRVLTGAMEAFVTSSEAFIETSAELDPDAFLSALEASTALDALADRVSVACTTWEHRAADLGHPVELGC